MNFRYAAVLYFSAIVLTGGAYGNLNNTDILVRSNGKILGKIYDVLSRNHDNLLISPLSLNYALTLLSLGADGNTLNQIRTALDQPNDEQAVISSYREFLSSIKDSPQLVIVNKIYIDNNYKIKSEFMTNVKENFGPVVENIDFANQPEKSRIAINKFVDEKTHHLIPQLLEGGVNSVTKAVIINTLYFKASWIRSLTEHLTRKQSFYALDGKEYAIDMMTFPGRLIYRYLDDTKLDAQILEIPYQDEYSFVVILPNLRNGIIEVENKIKSKFSESNSSPLAELFKDSVSEELHVVIPKFSFSQTHDLEDALIQIGITDIFKSSANFKKLSNEQLDISEVIQKARIVVNENGTEAAAATGLQFVKSAFNYPTEHLKRFVADHPFIYMINHRGLQTPLFVGRFMQP